METQRSALTDPPKTFYEPQEPFFSNKSYRHFLNSLENDPGSQSPSASASSTSEKKSLRGRLERKKSEIWGDTAQKINVNAAKSQNLCESFSSSSGLQQSRFRKSFDDVLQMENEVEEKDLFSYKFSKDYNNGIEEEFVNKIYYLEDLNKKFVYFDDNDAKNTELSGNIYPCLSISEAAIGFAFVIKTKVFLESLLFHFYKHANEDPLSFYKKYEQISDEEKKKNEHISYKCLLIFKEWIKNCKFFEPCINDDETYSIIVELFAALKFKYGKDIFKTDEVEVEFMRFQERVRDIENSNLVVISDFSKFISFFKGNAEQIALELFASSIAIQNLLNSNVVNKNKMRAIQDKIGEANDKLTKMILNDILGNISLEKTYELSEAKQKKIIANKKKKKVEFYIKLARYSKEYGDLFSCLALVGAFNSSEMRNDKDLAKLHWSDKKFIKSLTELFMNPNGACKRGEVLKKLPVPVFFPGFFAECELSKEKFPPFENDDIKSINLNYVKRISSVISDLAERQQKTQHIKAQTNFSSLLLSDENSHVTQSL